MATYKTAVIGDLATTLPFKAMGLTTIIDDGDADIGAQFDGLVKSGEFGAIFITEESADKIAEQIEAVRYNPLPSVILIPTVRGSLGKGKNAVRETMKRAAGRDIMGE
ncbi:MAG TPA: V-type ATP synthase subunit F [candidate division Zixibacteria bacterium]|nr:V-type ATP synthase subunit F [candidate division Zixibacteria bacterium]